MTRRTHIYFAAQPQLGGPTIFVEPKHNPLTLAQHAKDRPRQRARGQVIVIQIGVAHDDTITTAGIVGLDDSLHDDAAFQPALTILPDLMQPVQTFRRVGVLPTKARTFWIFGFQRRFVRRCECDTAMPHDGPLPHTSHTDAMIIHFRKRGSPLKGCLSRCRLSACLTGSVNDTEPTPIILRDMSYRCSPQDVDTSHGPPAAAAVRRRRTSRRSPSAARASRSVSVLPRASRASAR